MFRRRANPTLTFALCASLVLHALLLLSFLYWYVHRPSVVYARAEVQPDKGRAAIIVDAPPREPPQKKPAAPKPPPAPTKQFPHAPTPPLRDDSGETNGKGTANRSSPGAQPMQAQQGLEQAKLSRSPKPMPDDSASGLDMPPAPRTDQPITKTPEPAEVGVPPKDNLAAPAPVERPKMIAVADPTQSAPPRTKVTVAAVHPPTPPANKPHGAQPGRSSDTDSMPFAHANNVTFKDGQMMGRQGRRVRTTHIDFGLAGPIVASSLADPRVVLGVTVDATGNVQNVVLLRSSGSDTIDQPAENEIYNWWFEPLKDPAGKPQPDVWVVTIE